MEGMLMDEQNRLTMLQEQLQLKQMEDTNQYTEQFGVLSKRDAQLLLTEKIIFWNSSSV